jgi:hypothetical protein
MLTQISPTDALGVQKIPHRKIPKPPGELTRLSRGGYSLERALGWDQERYRKIQVSLSLVHTTARTYLVLSTLSMTKLELIFSRVFRLKTRIKLQ